MKPLLRPVRSLLTDEAPSGSVTRVWARMQLQRRVSRPTVPSWLAAGALAAGALFLVGMLRPHPVELAPRPVEVKTAAPLLQGRSYAQSLTRPTKPRESAQTPAPPSTGAPVVHVEPPPDVVGELIASAEDAWAAEQPRRALALLTEVAEHHPGDPRAAEAFIGMGMIELDALGHPALAVSYLHRALELGPPEDLVGPLWVAHERASEAARKASADEAPATP